MPRKSYDFAAGERRCQKNTVRNFGVDRSAATQTSQSLRSPERCLPEPFCRLESCVILWSLYRLARSIKCLTFSCLAGEYMLVDTSNLADVYIFVDTHFAIVEGMHIFWASTLLHQCSFVPMGCLSKSLNHTIACRTSHIRMSLSCQMTMEFALRST